MFSGRCPQAPRPFRPRSECAKRVPQTALSISGKYGHVLANRQQGRQAVRRSTCRGQDGQSSGGSCLPAGPGLRKPRISPFATPGYTSGGGIDPRPQRIPLGRARDARLDRRPLKPFDAGSDRLSRARAHGRRGGRTIGLRHGRPCAVHGQDARTGREAWPPAPMAFGRLP